MPHHRDLAALVSQNTFREDLFYRIHRLSIHIAPLRQRTKDIEPLCEYFLEQIKNEVGKRVLSKKALSLLISHQWPGNVRELRNVVMMSAALSPEEVISSCDVQHALKRISGCPTINEQALEDIVHDYRGNVSAAARVLGIPRTTLRDKLKRFQSKTGNKANNEPCKQ